MSIEKAEQNKQVEAGSEGQGAGQRPLNTLWPGRGWLGWGVGLLALLALAVYPLLNGQDTFAVGLLTEMLIYGLFALSLNLLLGYTGLVSFGHASFFGLGAYSVGILATRVENNSFLVGIAASLLVGAVGALVLGFFSIRTSGIYFLMLTLAFSQMLYAIAFKWTDFTGGSNGLTVRTPELNLFGWTVDLGQTSGLYWVTLACFVIGFFVLRQVVQSPFGHSLVGIRDNESRLTALGYQTRNFKLLAFVIAGGLAGVAGALNAYHNGFVSANEFYWTTSGLVLVMVLLGGKGSLVGPVLGAFFVRLAEQFIQGQSWSLGSFVVSERWTMVLGLVFIVFVLVAPSGIVGLWLSLVGLVQRRRGRAEAGLLEAKGGESL